MGDVAPLDGGALRLLPEDVRELFLVLLQLILFLILRRFLRRAFFHPPVECP